MLYVCVLCASCCSSQCYLLHDLLFINAGRGWKRRPSGRGILQSRSHNCFVGSPWVSSLCLPHLVAMSGLWFVEVCVRVLRCWCMYVLYVSFMSKVRPRTFGYVAMGSALLFIVNSRLVVYSAGFGVNRVQVVLSGFSMRLFCFVQAKTLCMYFFAEPVLVMCGCDGDVVCVGHDLNRNTGRW